MGFRNQATATTFSSHPFSQRPTGRGAYTAQIHPGFVRPIGLWFRSIVPDGRTPIDRDRGALIFCSRGFRTDVFISLS
jgi:hypothetical protein